MTIIVGGDRTKKKTPPVGEKHWVNVRRLTLSERARRDRSAAPSRHALQWRPRGRKDDDIVGTPAGAAIVRRIAERARSATGRIYCLQPSICEESDGYYETADDAVTLRVIAKPTKDAAGSALGVAPRSRDGVGRFVYAFYSRIKDYARQQQKPVSQILGYVMAHELGHVLLAYGSHSKRGIMMEAWNRSEIELIERGWLSFTADQAQMIRGRAAMLISNR